MDSILLAIQLWHIEFAKVAGLDNHIIINIFENYLPKGLSKGWPDFEDSLKTVFQISQTWGIRIWMGGAEVLRGFAENFQVCFPELAVLGAYSDDFGYFIGVLSLLLWLLLLLMLETSS